MNTTDKVKQYLTTCDLARSNRHRVAKTLAMSESTMRRRLVEEGVRFSALQENERKRRVLESPKAGGKQLASHCGYTELNSFYRFFKACFGQNYRDYKRALV